MHTHGRLWSGSGITRSAVIIGRGIRLVIMSKKWHKGYGIDDEGRRTIVITENAPQKTPVDRLMELVTHGAGIMIAICALLCVAIMLVESASEGIAGFFGTHRWVLVVAIVVAVLFFLGKVSARMRGDGGKPSSYR